jgi:hypothetical protein
LANSFTALGFIKPEVGADTNLWGGHWNQNADLLDALLERYVGTTTTRLLSFDVTGVSTTTTRTVIWQDSSGTIPLVAAHTTQVFTGTAGAYTYTPNPNMYCCLMKCVGPGGGGPSSASPAGLTLVGGGGGSGGVSWKLATAAAVGTSQPVILGSGGAGGAAGANPGGDGGDTSVGSLCIGKGGKGGAISVHNNTIAAGGAGGVAGTGDVTLPGNQGGGGQNLNYTNAGWLGGTGWGAPSILGGRVETAINTTAANTGASAPANSGAGGAASWNLNGANSGGGNGGTGFVIITEYLKK